MSQYIALRLSKSTVERASSRSRSNRSLAYRVSFHSAPPLNAMEKIRSGTGRRSHPDTLRGFWIQTEDQYVSAGG